MLYADTGQVDIAVSNSLHLILVIPRLRRPPRVRAFCQHSRGPCGAGTRQQSYSEKQSRSKRTLCLRRVSGGERPHIRLCDPVREPSFRARCLSIPVHPPLHLPNDVVVGLEVRSAEPAERIAQVDLPRERRPEQLEQVALDPARRRGRLLARDDV